MHDASLEHGSFTLPGEAGYEDLTLKLARQWGADTIRDSDGTQLSDKILDSGYDIYSTLCLVRADNEWAKAHPEALQQAFLMSFPVTAESSVVTIDPLTGYFREQFELNLAEDPKEWWQVHDRTSGEEVPPAQWTVDPVTGAVTITGARPWHRYTVNFLTRRIWEEISMYNHLTNDWGDREHLRPIDPIHPAVRDQIRAYLDRWLEAHPHTRVVRLTSMFYNFFWPWGDSPERRFILNDWGSYEFSVSAEAIRQFEKSKGYRPTAEDFINGGAYCSSHAVPSPVYRDWMAFVHDFMIEFGKECVARIQAAGKQAYVFYNDHWIGLEPSTPRFAEFGFDGIIDGIFSGFEARKVAATEGVKVRELRFHPYFFPTGVNGAPSFLPGGDPTAECQAYWIDIRRALLRRPVDRIGFGGYLHLVENHPRFVTYVTALAREFRQLKALHREGAPYTPPLRVAFLTAWGQTRAWACCGHFNHGHPYNEAMESLSGLPVETTFLSFDELLEDGIPDDLDVIINAGHTGDAWSGGRYWGDPRIVERLGAWVGQGGGLIGIGEPSAFPTPAGCFKLAHLFGVEKSGPVTRNQTPRQWSLVETPHFITLDLESRETVDLGVECGGLHVEAADTNVLLARQKSPRLATRECGEGRCVYFSGHRYSSDNARLLHRALFWAARREDAYDAWTTDHPATECAWFPEAGKLVVVNNSPHTVSTHVHTGDGHRLPVTIEPRESVILSLDTIDDCGDSHTARNA